MKTIGELMPTLTKIESGRNGCVSLSKTLSNDAVELLQRYPTANDFRNEFSVKLQTATALFKERTFDGTSPTLRTIREAYGSEICNVWIMLHLEQINLFAGVKKKLTKEAMEELAYMIQAECYYFKASELMFFIHKLKMGKYGSFYGVVDAMKITEALNKFIEERQNYIHKLEEEKRQLKREKMFEGSISREKYDSIKERAQTDIDAFKQLFKCFPNDKPIEEYWEAWKSDEEKTRQFLIEHNENYKTI